MAVITISRQFGAGGITVGEVVAQKLGYKFYDNEIIQLLAKEAKVSTNWVEDLEKEAGGALQKFLSQVVPKSMVERILDDKRGYIDEEIYVDLLHLIIKKIADDGNAVIIGRGGQYILAGQPDVYHILLVADKSDRIKFIEEKYGLRPKRAVQTVNFDDKRRVNLYRKFGREDYDHPIHYQLVINTSKISREKAADLVCKLVSSGA
ncbi:cytidylate kinase-like family protein [Desulfobacteraceae bacterium SEEP-SAG9]|nr:cytidylate kinase-like family protein [Desulfobacteraceae bacterium SEEP-SAG9]